MSSVQMQDGKFTEFITKEFIIWHPDYVVNTNGPEGWYGISRIDQGLVAFASTKKHAESACTGLADYLGYSRRVGNGTYHKLLLPEYSKIRAHGFAVTLRHGLLCSAPMAMDEMILEKHLEVVEKPKQDFLDAANLVLGTTFSVSDFQSDEGQLFVFDGREG